MTYVEFAENVLGMELLDWQKFILETAQECKENGERFYINMPAQEGKDLSVMSVIPKMIGYEKGLEDGYNKAVDDIIDLFGCSDEDIYAKETIREWLNNVKKEMN